MSAEKATPLAAVSVLRWVSMLATAALAAKGEFDLALVIGLPVVAAVLFPLGLDAYMWAAIMRGRSRDVAWALGLAIVAQVAAHLVHADWSRPGMVALTVVVSAVPPLVCWRVHQLAEPEPQPEPEPEPVREPTFEEAVAELLAELPPKGKRTAGQTSRFMAKVEALAPGISNARLGELLGVSAEYVGRIARTA
ncbi:hypothetical protein [Longispora albida]|uniref:hypothetical protein n=1 Tax=Longispora albida TaxID=203523 RepID=UPI000371519D|nr:hypothetical protein [Longispora albida]